MTQHILRHDVQHRGATFISQSGASCTSSRKRTGIFALATRLLPSIASLMEDLPCGGQSVEGTALRSVYRRLFL